MPEDVGGAPSADGREPDEDHNRGGADDEFASVVFDEEFVRSAPVHEPTAVERLLAAAEARAEASEAESRRARTRRPRSDDDFYDEGFDPDDARGRHDHEFDDDLYDPDLLEDGYGRRLRYGAPARWHRSVAWLLAVLMGVGMVALAFTAVYRGASSGRQDRVPAPASTEVEKTPPRHGSTPRTPVDGSRHSSGGTPSAHTRAFAENGEGAPEDSRSPVPAIPHSP
ncbi:hypothetical protein GCM10018793_62560 [Streptomyces sulfonofaciens]|uniref:Uncharacterized protein n=1 Tax=Streptomyces sulfonofaciens TaxID=68272 RepID=A0A919L950_9ACTN|nr:hypothetical protein [Streptomyces sulfonofaciens]GHH87296.1 hypothetical protein GCM10018793_62560 [Streptomyces sulfonofaciens]